MRKMGKIRKVLLLVCATIASVCTFVACGGGDGGESSHVHAFEQISVVEPTCTETGYTVYACACGEEKRDNETQALGHNLGDCTLNEKGETSGTCKRLACKQTLTIARPLEEIFKVEGAKLAGLQESVKNQYISLYLPTEIGGVKMTSVGNSAFKNNEYLVDVYVPNGYISIGDSAFSSCSNLTCVDLSTDLETIGAWAFFNDKKLTQIRYHGLRDEWDDIRRNANWDNTTAIADVVCLRDDWRVLSEIKLNGQELRATTTANFDYQYDKAMRTFTENGEGSNCKGFYPLKATQDYVLRVRMGANSGETDFIIYASETNYITFRTGTDGHARDCLFISANGSWHSETRFGYDLFTFVNLDGMNGMVEFTVVRYNQGFYVYVCDYIDMETGALKKHENWKLVFYCTVLPDDAEFKTETQDPWRHVITNGKTVRAELKSGVKGVVSAHENAFMLRNVSSKGATWQVSLDDMDARAAAFVSNPEKVGYWD